MLSTSDSPKVLMLITHLDMGGAQKVMQDHALAFSAFATVHEAAFDSTLPGRAYHSGFPLHGLQDFPWLEKLGPPGRLLARSLALRRLCEREKFDWVISHMDGANWVNVLSFSRARKILVVHGTVAHDENISAKTQWLRRWVIFPLIYNMADYTVAVSQAIAHELKRIGRVRNAVAMQNFFDIHKIENLSQQPVLATHEACFQGRFILVTTGRLCRQKQQWHLLHVMRRLAAQGLRCRLLVLGDGELRQDLLNQSRELGLQTWDAWTSSSDIDAEDEVCFLGAIQNPYAYMRRADLFVFPSAWEGFPLALCEAMICGAPVISADCPTGPREILDAAGGEQPAPIVDATRTECGVLMPTPQGVEDHELWANEIKALVSDEAARRAMSVAAIRRMKLWGKEAVVPRWREMLLTPTRRLS